MASYLNSPQFENNLIYTGDCRSRQYKFGAPDFNKKKQARLVGAPDLLIDNLRPKITQHKKLVHLVGAPATEFSKTSQLRVATLSKGQDQGQQFLLGSALGWPWPYLFQIYRENVHISVEYRPCPCNTQCIHSYSAFLSLYKGQILRL
jgi:hypothetical protein